MPVPAEYERASAKFYAFLVDVRDASGLWSTHVAYTMTQGVLQTFRRRLSCREAIAFANLLPVGLRALFVSDWDTEEPLRPFTTHEEMTREVRSLRLEHNFSPDSAIRDVVGALRKQVDEASFDALLETLPKGAVEFWRP
jgi:uncharacterized protein (DUF2267 family)